MYSFLMDHYQPGDRIFLFGYSRGAHTVRQLAAMLHRVGLLTHGSYNLIPYARKINRRTGEEADEIAERFKDGFCRRPSPQPHFLGVFDTVASVGVGPFRRYYRDRKLNQDVRFAYQALSVDEKRRHFRVARWDESDLADRQTMLQVWFPGHHADVGGQGADRPISDIPLEWMLRHAAREGLALRQDWREELVRNPWGDLCPPPLFLHLPGLTEVRRIPEGARVHRSVFIRRAEAGNNYRPPNIPARYEVVD